MAVGQRMSQAQRRAMTRERLLDAAEKLFTKRGFHATSLDAVALEAGYTKGAVYGHFESKDDLFLAVYERRVTARTDEALVGLESMPWDAAVTTVMDRYQEMLRARPLWRALVIEFAAHAVRRPALRRRFAAAHSELNARIRDRLPRMPDHLDQAATTAMFTIITSGTSLETLIDPRTIPDGLPGRMAVHWLKGAS